MWLDDLQHGQGLETWLDGSSYQGNYFQGKKQGKGQIFHFICYFAFLDFITQFIINRKYIWADSSVYTGEWHDNKISGYGVYTWVDGRSYTGEWLENNMSGHGVYKWQDGRMYEGSYLLDKKEGYGEYTWVNHIFLF